MKKLHTILLALFFGFCGFSQSPFLNITYTGNEGFLLESENKKVLIDALFKANYPDFLDPSEKMINQIINGKPPYDNLDLLLVTHRHADHFSPELTIQLLANQTDCKLVAHKQAVDKMREVEGFKKIESQVIEITSDFGSHSTKSLNGIDIDMFCMKHGPYIMDGRNIHEQVRNLAYIVNIDGIRFYHSGDATISENIEVLGKCNFIQKPVDVLFIQYYDTSPEAVKFIGETIKPDKIVAMHISPENIESSTVEFLKHYPYGEIFQEQGQMLRFKNSINYHTLSGPYFGQKPPEGKAEVFAPDIISSKRLEHSFPSFSPDGKEVIWSVSMNPIEELGKVLVYMKEENGLWSYPEIISFSGKFNTVHDNGPQFIDDGNYIVFSSRRQVETDEGILNQWKSFYSKRKNTGWEEEKEITDIPSGMKNYEILCIQDMPQGEIPLVKIDNRIYKLPKIDVEPLKNKGTINWTFYISPDENFAIFSSNRPGAYDEYGDLYISNKTANGS